MSKESLKKLIVNVCNNVYGFAPTKSQIVLLESDGIGHYIMFGVSDKVYQIHWLSYVEDYTIEKVEM